MNVCTECSWSRRCRNASLPDCVHTGAARQTWTWILQRELRIKTSTMWTRCFTQPAWIHHQSQSSFTLLFNFHCCIFAQTNCVRNLNLTLYLSLGWLPRRAAVRAMSSHDTDILTVWFLKLIITEWQQASRVAVFNPIVICQKYDSFTS